MSYLVLLKEAEEKLKHGDEVKPIPGQESPPCWNCSQIMTGAKDIYGNEVWVCWACAKWA